MTTTTDRFYLIAQLEAHYGRWLRSAVLESYKSYDTMITAYKEREAAGNVTTKTMSEVMEYMKKCDEFPHRIALEGQQIIEAARSIEDLKTLEILVKWQTLPNWKKLMQEDGWEFDTTTMRWTHEDKD